MKTRIRKLVVALQWCLVPLAATAQQGLFHTPAEVAIWQDRTVNGPYRVAGDADINTPGDWTRILDNANSFVSNPAADRWANYYDGAGAVPSGTDSWIQAYASGRTGLKASRAEVLQELGSI